LIFGLPTLAHKGQKHYGRTVLGLPARKRHRRTAFTSHAGPETGLVFLPGIIRSPRSYR
jgi:hypothetical protein